jgi:hypothetical protein
MRTTISEIFCPDRHAFFCESRAEFAVATRDQDQTGTAFNLSKKYQRAAKAKSLRHRAPSYEGARITPRVAAQNPTHAQSRQGDSKRYLEGLKRKRDSN